MEELESPKRPRLRASPAGQQVSVWSSEEVTGYLRDRGVPEILLQAFEDNAIEGRHLMELTEDDLTKMGISALGHRKDILAAVHRLKIQMSRQGEKVFNDPIHGHIELHPLMVKIIDTPQFQRLRYIKQLGGAYYVFPGASHNRFEHSIGVGYLAGELVETLQKKQPQLDITDQDVLCVKIAGLCHDLGHGPFSHMFDAFFIPKVLPGSPWKHEQASVMMFQHLIKESGLEADLEQYGLNSTDVDFIKEQIAGPLETETACSQSASDWPYVGRPESKSFLYEIVANKRNGIDVDKWDYFARDCHCLGIPNNFDMRRYMKFARVISVDNKRRQICTRDKEVSNLYEMFHTRSSLHRRAYQHKTAKIIETMITEALMKANDHLLIPGEKGPVRMSEAIHDPYAYTRLTDCVVQQILTSTDPNLSEAKDILERIERRQLYKCIGQTQPAASTVLSACDVPRLTSEIIGSLSSSDLDGLPALTEEDIIVEIVTYDYGMKDENPIDHMRFYLKSNPERAVKVRKDQVSQMLPQTFREQHIRVYCRKQDKDSLAAAWRYFITWCTKQKCITPKGGVLEDMDPDEVTPYNTPFGTPLKQEPASALRSPLNQGDIVKKLSFML